MPFPLLIPLALAAAGALIDKEKPLRGAALGAAAGFTGGAALGAGAAGAGAAGAAGTGGLLAAEGATAAGAGTGGLLAGESALGAGTLGTGSAQLGTSGLLGMGSAASGTAPEAAGAMMGAGSMSPVASTIGAEGGTGLLGTLNQYAKPAGQVMNAVQQGQQMADANEPPPVQPPQMQNVPLDLSSLLQHSQAMRQYEDTEQQRKRAMLGQWTRNIGGMA